MRFGASATNSHVFCLLPIGFFAEPVFSFPAFSVFSLFSTVFLCVSYCVCRWLLRPRLGRRSSLLRRHILVMQYAVTRKSGALPSVDAADAGACLGCFSNVLRLRQFRDGPLFLRFAPLNCRQLIVSTMGVSPGGFFRTTTRRASGQSAPAVRHGPASHVPQHVTTVVTSPPFRRAD